jgi:hypothetical protein
MRTPRKMIKKVSSQTGGHHHQSSHHSFQPAPRTHICLSERHTDNLTQSQKEKKEKEQREERNTPIHTNRHITTNKNISARASLRRPASGAQIIHFRGILRAVCHDIYVNTLPYNINICPCLPLGSHNTYAGQQHHDQIFCYPTLPTVKLAATPRFLCPHFA